MQDLFPHEYNPIIVTYNDRVARTFKNRVAIREAAQRNASNLAMRLS